MKFALIKSFVFGCSMLALVNLVSGCKSISDKPVETISNTENAKAAAEKYFDGFTAAIKENNFQKLYDVLDEAARKRVNKTEFETLRTDLYTNMGEITTTEYVCDLDQTVVRDYLWKVTFCLKSTTPEKKEKVVVKEMIYMVRVGQLDGKSTVAGAGFVL